MLFIKRLFEKIENMSMNSWEFRIGEYAWLIKSKKLVYIKDKATLSSINCLDNKFVRPASKKEIEYFESRRKK